MSAKPIVLLGAVLLGSMVQVAVCGPNNMDAVNKLNNFLADATGPDVDDLATNAAKAAAKDRSGYGPFEGQLKTAIRKFLIVAEAKSCTPQLADALVYLSIDPQRPTRVNKILRHEIFNGEMNNKCRDFLGQMAEEIVSKLPKDDGMQTFLRFVTYDTNRFKLSPLTRHFRERYFQASPPLIDELIGIAREKSIVLSETDKATGKRVDYEKRLDDLVETYYQKPGKTLKKLSSDFVEFAWLLVGANDGEFLSLPVVARDVIYRHEAYRMLEYFLGFPRSFVDNVKRKVFERY